MNCLRGAIPFIWYRALSSAGSRRGGMSDSVPGIPEPSEEGVMSSRFAHKMDREAGAALHPAFCPTPLADGEREKTIALSPTCGERALLEADRVYGLRASRLGIRRSRGVRAGGSAVARGGVTRRLSGRGVRAVLAGRGGGTGRSACLGRGARTSRGRGPVARGRRGGRARAGRIARRGAGLRARRTR